MLAKGAAETVANLDIAAFIPGHHQDIAQAVGRLVADGKPTDPVSVHSELQTAAPNSISFADVVELQVATPATTSADHYADLVQQCYLSRQRIGYGLEIAETGYAGGDPTQLIESLTRVGDNATTADPAHTLGDTLAEWLDDIETRQQQPTAIPTGLHDLDTVTGGLRAGQLIIVCARTSVGKSIFGGTIALNAGQVGHTTLICSVEMGRLELAERFVSNVSGINGTILRDGTIPPNDWPRIAAACAQLAELPITIDDRAALTVPMIRNRAKQTAGLTLLVVDYMQLLTADDPKIPREQQVARISAALKVLARELGIPVVALAQLNREVEQRRDKRPVLADLRESGAIENDADVVIGLYRDDYYNPDTKDRGVLEAIVMKQRGGPTCTVRLHFDGDHTAVRNLARF